MNSDDNWTMDIGRWHCVLEARPTGAFFQPIAICQRAQEEPMQLPQDTEPYATRAEALRHAQQQALRYVHQH